MRKHLLFIGALLAALSAASAEAAPLYRPLDLQDLRMAGIGALIGFVVAIFITCWVIARQEQDRG